MAFYPFGEFRAKTRDQSLMTYRNIRSDNIFANQIIISGGTKGFIRSENYVESTSGWAFFGDGSADIFGLTVYGDVVSGNWDGASNDLSGGPVAATAGYLLDHSAGAAQFESIYAIGGQLVDLTMTGDLTMTSGGVFATDSSAPRWYFDYTSFGSQNFVFDSGLPHEYSEGGLNAPLVYVNPTFEEAGVEILSPVLGDATNRNYSHATVYSDYVNGIAESYLRSWAWGNHGTDVTLSGYCYGTGSSSVHIDASSVSGTGYIQLNAKTSIQVLSGQFQAAYGTQAAPGVAFYNDSDTGIFRKTTNQLGISTGNAQAAYFWHDGTNGWMVSDVVQATNEFQAGNGSVSDPSYTFVSYGTSGMYTKGGGAVWITVLNNDILGLGTTELVPMGKIKQNYDGTVSAPAYSWNNDPDTGLYRSASNYFAVTAGGYIIQQWGWTGTNKEIYFYGLTSGSTNYVRYNGTSGHLQYSSSTIRIKKDIEPMPVGLTDLMPGGQWYRMRRNDEIDNPPMQRVPKEDGEGYDEVPLLVGEDDQEKERGGVIAEWTAAVDPRFGIYNEGDDQPINYEMEALVGAMLTDLQDARKRIHELEQQVQNLLT